MSSPQVTFGGRNWLRTATLVVSDGSVGIDLSNLRMRFEVRASDVETPNTLNCRVYNPSQTTVNDVVANATNVTLSAGYVEGNQGIIFEGQVKQFRFGRERNVDNYLDILAADGDQAYNNSVINQAFPAGTDDTQQLSAIGAAMNIPPAATNDGFLTTGGILPRGKTLFGMARVYARNIAQRNNCRWSIQNGVLTIIPVTGYLPGEAVAMNSASGMLGTPEQTDNGITVRCYLNPLVKIGQAVQINNRDINQTLVKQQFFPTYTSQYYPATVTNDGLYRVLVVEHEGDTRGNSWETTITCLSIDPSSAANNSVLPNG